MALLPSDGLLHRLKLLRTTGHDALHERERLNRSSFDNVDDDQALEVGLDLWDLPGLLQGLCRNSSTHAKIIRRNAIDMRYVPVSDDDDACVGVLFVDMTEYSDRISN